MKRLFSDPFETWTAEATEFGTSVRDALRPLVKSLFDSGVDSHDIEYVIQSEAMMLIAELRMRRGIAIRKESLHDKKEA
jgi:hypothetical protein